MPFWTLHCGKTVCTEWWCPLGVPSSICTTGSCTINYFLKEYECLFMLCAACQLPLPEVHSQEKGNNPCWSQLVCRWGIVERGTRLHAAESARRWCLLFPTGLDKNNLSMTLTVMSVNWLMCPSQFSIAWACKICTVDSCSECKILVIVTLLDYFVMQWSWRSFCDWF